MNTDWRSLLIAQRDSLLADLGASVDASATVELDQTRVGRLSRMDALQAQAMAQATDQRRHLELRQIGAALARIDAGTFGVCAACEAPISAARLAFAPANPLCLKCAESREK